MIICIIVDHYVANSKILKYTDIFFHNTSKDIDHECDHLAPVISV